MSIVLIRQMLPAQERPNSSFLAEELTLSPDFARVDSLRGSIQARVQPANMSFVERRMLGENGTLQRGGFVSAGLTVEESPENFLAVNDPYLPQESVRADSLPRPITPKLLPANMSFLERGLWGENGFFRGIGIASPLTPEVRKHELSVRRTMLTMHQIGGFITLGLMATTVYWGQKTLDNPGALGYRSNHQTFVTATIISYSATALLSVLSPPPLIRRDETSTTTIHKTLAWVHFAGMILTPILGASLHRNFSNDQTARFHQVSAYITTAALAASLIVVTF